MFEVVDHVIDERAVAGAVADPGAGAVCAFSGVVRDHSRGKRVLYLEYEAYPAMAVKQMRRIADEIKERWGITRVAIVHRTGRLNVG
ncbi:MAG: molybdenum cofactor biosynthesis protein MoaE, partial [Chloroflexi bacterium]|nr:molybdenum cofactor biosynthesis protein MoaE [Chloroflexota bacterium]